MTIFISLISLLVLGIVLLANEHKWDTGVIGILFTLFSSTLLIMALILLITNFIEVKADINEFLATKATIETAREIGVDVENTAIQHKVIESNQWLAKQQYYNSTVFDIWVPDGVDDLKPIR